MFSFNFKKICCNFAGNILFEKSKIIIVIIMPLLIYDKIHIKT